MDFGPNRAGRPLDLLGSLAGAHLHVQVGLSAPNRPVIVPPRPTRCRCRSFPSGG
jgi:hypothetical protein